MSTKPTASTGSAKWDEQPLEWLRDTGRVELLIAALEVRKKRQRRRRAISGAAAAAVVLGLVCLWLWQPGQVPDVRIRAVTDSHSIVVVPERRVLPDGSVVELKRGAEMRVSISSDATRPRVVSLTQGEAHFQVADNPDRPFVVHAGNVSFRALGTAFSVQVGGSGVELLVTEGRVAVETQASAGDTPKEVAIVTAGNHLVVESTTASPPDVRAVSDTYTREKLAWRVPRLTFDETPLWEVVSLINQYSGSRISLASSELGRVEISGTLRADNLEPLLRMLEANYSIEIVRVSGGEIVLRSHR